MTKCYLHQPDHVIIQKLFKPSEDGGEILTLKHLLDTAVPELTETGIDLGCLNVIC